MNRHLLATLIAWAALSTLANADTIKHRTKDIVYHGYVTTQRAGSQNIVMTEEKGPLELNMSDYEIEFNGRGRNRHVALLTIPETISLEHETNAFTEAIVQESDKGPLLILIEIDTPGGRVDLAKKIVASISDTKFCQTVAYVKGGQNGGAISAGAAVSLACDKIYMSPETSIGAATMITHTKEGTTDMKGAYGEAVGEKFNSAWRGYLDSLAQSHNRPGALAMAMADKDIVVVEVKRDGKSLFIEKSDKLSTDKEVRTICRRGELLTLPAKDAVNYQLADGIVSSRRELMAQLNCGDAEVVESQHLIDAKAEFEKVEKKFVKLMERIILKLRETQKKSSRGMTKSQAKKDLLYLKKNTEYLLNLKRTYPDIQISEESIQILLMEIKSDYEAVKSIRPR